MADDIKFIEPNPTFSRATVHNGIIYFCGHVDGKRHATIKEQTKALLERYDELFKQYGTDKEHLLMVTIYISDMALKAEMNEVYNAWTTPGKAPARVCVEAKIDDGFFLEMSVIAVVC
jgi:Putative translation initiation inhibitor, yjgF family